MPDSDVSKRRDHVMDGCTAGLRLPAFKKVCESNTNNFPTVVSDSPLSFVCGCWNVIVRFALATHNNTTNRVTTTTGNFMCL